MLDDFGFLFWLHFSLLSIGFFSPFLFNYWLILFGVGVVRFQWSYFGGCYLTTKQFKEEGPDRMTFYRYYLGKVGYPIDNRMSHIIAARIIPSVVISLAIFLQVLLQYQPLIF